MPPLRGWRGEVGEFACCLEIGKEWVTRLRFVPPLWGWCGESAESSVHTCLRQLLVRDFLEGAAVGARAPSAHGGDADEHAAGDQDEDAGGAV